jgi:hypothetical protein
VPESSEIVNSGLLSCAFCCRLLPFGASIKLPRDQACATGLMSSEPPTIKSAGVGTRYPFTIVKLSDRGVERKPAEVAVIVRV